MLTGRVFDISGGRIDDGPGLRTVVFMKGCRLGCPWCHNPEGVSSAVEIRHSIDRCIRCGECLKACPRDWPFDVEDAWREGCELSGACVEACPTGARQLVGADLTPQEVVDAVLADCDFFRGTGGGVTFSGGEPLLQASFVLETADRLRSRGIHVAVETAGFFSPRWVAPLARAADLILYDLKHTDAGKLSRVLAKGAPLVCRNLAALLEHDVELEVHVTLVPGFNETEADLAQIGAWLNQLPRTPPVRLKPFHRMAAGKPQGLARGATYAYAAVPPLRRQDVFDASAYLASLGLAVDVDAV